MELIIKKDLEQLSEKLATWIVHYIETKLAFQPFFSFVLSGGSTPVKLYELLSSAPLKDKVEWSRVHFFWGDERYFPFEDSRNNAKMAFEHLLDHLPVVKEQVHIINTNKDPMESAAEYEKILRNFFPDDHKTFDLVLLGLGDNAHTLSLFPGYDVVMEKKHWVRSFYLAEQSMYRITLTASVVNRSAAVVFIVSGKEKAPALRKVMEAEYNPGKYPAQAIKPGRGDLYWFIDEAAAGSTI